MGFDAMSYLLGRKLQHAREHHSIYGFHIDSGESDPSEAVTYLADAVGLTPAHMDFVNDAFVWGSWADAFFLPRPCMLKYDGTVDYYLDPADYTKKLDGTASDVADDSYGGNAMMEWGRNGRRIWYKIVPDSADPSSASVYIADHRADGGYRAWSFVNSAGMMTEHFYTPIYNGTLDANGRLRSVSGKGYAALSKYKTAEEEIAAAELNNPGTDKLWYTEVYADVTLINLLLILMAKSLDTQSAYGNGRTGQGSGATAMLGTGTMDDKGLFWGSAGNSSGVKIFGMENWWGNQWRRYAGHMMVDYVHQYKMTRGRQDGSAADDYNITGSGYLSGATAPQSDDYIKKMQFNGDGFLSKETGGSSASYWCDTFSQGSGTRYAAHGSAAASPEGAAGAFALSLFNPPSRSFFNVGAALSCKPMA
ncbi:MAG: hypothetical protein IJF88_10650 [Oscillospiraceae bacterium]|nr:hypothetical protein [Oscillospiraceae bacterium]